MPTRQIIRQLPLINLYEPTARWGGHEGLAPLSNRLLKVLMNVKKNAYCFCQPNYWVQLGWTETIGKSSLYWAEAFKLVEPVVGSKRSGGVAAYLLSERGKLLLEADPYLESPNIFWVLYWWLMSPPCLYRAGNWLVNYFLVPDFYQDQLKERLEDDNRDLHSSWCKDCQEEGESPLSKSQLDEEVRCLMRTFVASPNLPFEEACQQIISRLEIFRYEPNELEANIQKMQERQYKNYLKQQAKVLKASQAKRRKKPEPIPTLEPVEPNPKVLLATKITCMIDSRSGWGDQVPPEVIVYSTLEYIQSQVCGNMHQSGSIALKQILYERYSPGITFKLSETVFQKAWDKVAKEKLLEGIQFDCSANITQIAWSVPLSEIKMRVWESLLTEGCILF